MAKKYSVLNIDACSYAAKRFFTKAGAQRYARKNALANYGVFKNNNTLVYSNNARYAGLWNRPHIRDLAKQIYPARPAVREMFGGAAANARTLKGIYTGAHQDFALSSYISTGMADVPKNLTGVPAIRPVEDGEADNPLVKELTQLLVDEYPIIAATMLIQGTAWRWAVWSDRLQKLVWESIPDESITGLILDLETGEITGLWIEEQISYTYDRYSPGITTRIRHITKEVITEEWRGRENKYKQYRNPFGHLPIPFGHNCLEGEWRGNSVYSRVLRLLKANHDIAYKRDEILGAFEPKLVQSVEDAETWIRNNTEALGRNKQELDPFSQRLVVNQTGESTAFLFLPADATSQHTLALQDNMKKIILGSGIPELFFGGLATGNYAGTETDRLLALEYVKSIRRELTRATESLVNQSLEVLGFVRHIPLPKVNITWGTLTLLSETQKAQIMGSYAGAIGTLLQGGSVSPEGAYFLTKELYPDFPGSDGEDFLGGLNRMLREHSGKIGQPVFEGNDFLDGGFSD